MQQHYVELNDGTNVRIPDLCLTHDVPYSVLDAPRVDEEHFCFLDRASISTTLSKKYGVPFGRLQAFQSLSTGSNSICAIIVHKDCPNGVEIELGGYLLGSYCGMGVEITVQVPKEGGTGINRDTWHGDPEHPINWKDFK